VGGACGLSDVAPAIFSSQRGRPTARGPDFAARFWPFGRRAWRGLVGPHVAAHSFRSGNRNRVTTTRGCGKPGWGTVCDPRRLAGRRIHRPAGQGCSNIWRLAYGPNTRPCDSICASLPEAEPDATDGNFLGQVRPRLPLAIAPIAGPGAIVPTRHSCSECVHQRDAECLQIRAISSRTAVLVCGDA
jgi:hypothetical protein